MFADEDFERLRGITRDGFFTTFAPPYMHREGGPGTFWICKNPRIVLDGVTHVPSIAAWSKSTLEQQPDEGATVECAPDWVFEVVARGESREALGVRMRAFAKALVPYAWVADPLAQMVVLYEREGDKWRRMHLIAGDALVKHAPFTAVEVELVDVWPIVQLGMTAEEGGSEDGAPPSSG